jgi:hypothetical protein
MFRLITTTSFASMALGLITLAGCASSTTRGDDPPKASAATAAMSCPTCETVWVRELTGQGTKVQRFSSNKQMVCPECDATAAAFLDGDQKVLHNCPQCRVTPTPLMPVSAPQQPSHPKGTHS